MDKKLKSATAHNLGYTGMVKLYQYCNGKKISIAEAHNEGGKALFNFLADCLVGDADLTNRPTKILLLNIDDERNVSVADNMGFIYLLTKPERIYSGNNESIVRYSFTIPQEYFIGTDFNAIGLYNNAATMLDVQDYAACCLIDSSEWSLSISSVLVLDWELHLTNYNPNPI
jgi:hypothetical protein